ncbi:hypothetical protein RchiOBHm_Chr5g0059861 [Rosa chinensis]|uniref:Uncharacterized protein n=1 Tax=Rosa chinensis TaxID=74649 RepID=A0A2P6QHK0_ROSCH|nr:hypothetical protein RchiOBHm_Chr5g0059861 [Rosa chinensis]
MEKSLRFLSQIGKMAKALTLFECALELAKAIGINLFFFFFFNSDRQRIDTFTLSDLLHS